MPHAAYLLGLRLEPVAKCSFASLTNGIFPVFSVHSSPPCSFKFLQTFCVLAVCHFAVAWQWSDKTKDVAGCMANGLQERRALHCSWPALVLPVLCSCPALALLLAISCPTTDLHLTSSHSSAARQRVSSEWATDSPKLCSPATACYAHADERRRFCFCCFFFAIAQLPLLLLLVVAGNQKHVWPTAGMRHSFIVVTVDGRRAPPRRRLQSFLLIFPKREFMLPSELDTVHNYSQCVCECVCVCVVISYMSSS